jgi:hypothetical protein
VGCGLWAVGCGLWAVGCGSEGEEEKKGIEPPAIDLFILATACVKLTELESCNLDEYIEFALRVIFATRRKTDRKLWS